MTIGESALFFLNSDNFLLISHESPDADAIGSELALYHILKKKGKEVIIVNNDIADPKYNFFEDISLIKNLKSPEIKKTIFSKKWQTIVLDTFPDHLGDMDEKLKKVFSDPFIIDHHDGYIDESEHRGIFDSKASSTCEIIALLLEEMNVSLSRSIAIPLFAGIVYDTGSFVYPKTSSRTFRIAEKLLKYGAVPNQIYKQLYQNKSVEVVKLQALVLQTLEYYYNNKLAILVLRPDMLEETGALISEAHAFVDIPLQSRDVEISLFIRLGENESGGKCSLRSKGVFDCFEIAEHFGGGGHKTASGFRFSGSVDDIKTKVLELIKKNTA